MVGSEVHGAVFIKKSHRGRARAKHKTLLIIFLHFYRFWLVLDFSDSMREIQGGTKIDAGARPHRFAPRLGVKDGLQCAAPLRPCAPS